MTLAQYVMLAVAMLSGLAWRWNATSAALAFSYFATQVWWLIAGSIGAGDMFMIDTFTIALIYCKAIARCPEQEFRNAWEQIRCFLFAPTFRDRAVLTVYPFMWLAYIARIDEFSRWYALWGLAMIQFLIAGSEALLEWRKANAPADEPDLPSSGLMFAVTRVERWST